MAEQLISVNEGQIHCSQEDCRVVVDVGVCVCFREKRKQSALASNRYKTMRGGD